MPSKCAPRPNRIVGFSFSLYPCGRPVRIRAFTSFLHCPWSRATSLASFQVICLLLVPAPTIISSWFWFPTSSVSLGVPNNPCLAKLFCDFLSCGRSLSISWFLLHLVLVCKFPQTFKLVGYTALQLRNCCTSGCKYD